MNVLEVGNREIRTTDPDVALLSFTAQKMKFSIDDFFSKCDQIRRKRFCAVFIVKFERIQHNIQHINFIFLCCFCTLFALWVASYSEVYLKPSKSSTKYLLQGHKYTSDIYHVNRTHFKKITNELQNF